MQMSKSRLAFLAVLICTSLGFAQDTTTNSGSQLATVERARHRFRVRRTHQNSKPGSRSRELAEKCHDNSEDV